jgi:hypothetical protein
VITVDGASKKTDSSVEQRIDKTSHITGIVPPYGSVRGGDTVTITGTNFKATGNTALFSGVTCAIVTESTTKIQCKTGPKPVTNAVSASP